MNQTPSAAAADAVPVGSAAGRLTWERLLQMTAVLESVTLLAVAFLLADVEAAAVGLGVTVGIGLLWFRGGQAGRFLLALASTNVLVWMSLATVHSLVGGDGIAALFIPALLAVLSLATLIAAVGAAVARRRTAAPTSSPAAVAAAAATLFAVVLVGGAVAPSRPQASARAGDLALSTAQLAFTETNLVADAGEVRVVVDNQDLFWHTFTIDELGVDLPVSVNSTRTTTFEAEPGVYTYYCRIPGHESVMRGTLTVR